MDCLERQIAVGPYPFSDGGCDLEQRPCLVYPEGVEVAPKGGRAEHRVELDVKKMPQTGKAYEQ